MAKKDNKSVWILVVVIAVALQLLFVVADCRQSATGTAVAFSKAYFMLDDDLEKFRVNDVGVLNFIKI